MGQEHTKGDDSHLDAALWTVVEGVETETGERFFYSLVRHLALALHCQYAFVSELVADRQCFRTLAVWGRGEFLPNFELPLAGTPCEAVLRGHAGHHPEKLRQLFPQDQGLKTWGVESYAGVPLLDRDGRVLGHFAILDDRPMPNGQHNFAIMRIFASRAYAEIERLKAEAQLRASEEQYRDLYEAAPLPIVTLSKDGRIVACNRRFAEWAGLSEEEVLRRGFADFSVPDAIARRRELHALVMSGRPVEEEIQVCPPGGARCWIRLAQRPIRDASGAVVAAQAVFIDITERKRAEEALEQSEARYRDLYEAAPLPIVSVDLQGNIVASNRRFLDWAGISAADVAALSLTDFSTPQTLPQIRDMQKHVMNGEELDIEGFVNLPSTGAPRWLRIATRPIRDEAGATIASEVMFMDLSAQKQAELELRASEERLASIFDSAMDAIITFDSTGLIELFSGAAQRTFKCSAEKTVGQLLDHFLTDSLREALSDITRKGGVGSYRMLSGLKARRADGEEFLIEATVSRAEVRGRPLFTLILRDVDEQRRQEEERRHLRLQNEYLQEEIKAVLNADEVVGESPALTAVMEKARMVADTNSTVLILGETGTGKELFAHAIHDNSARRSRPLVKVNCAALPTGLVETELFGHEKGAFTGAAARRIGRFELAHGGTIFLDEIGELPLELQAKLLRVLQEHEFERVGGHETISVDVRVIAATNRQLARAVEEKSFRQDLYYRLNVFPLTLPPLRERKDDIPLLVHYFVQRYAAKIGRRISRVPRVVMERLVAYTWPGNVRELENVVERAVILSIGPELEVAADLLPTVEPVVAQKRPELKSLSPESTPDAGETLDEVQRVHIVAALKRSNWRIDGPSGAAQALRLNPSTLRSRMKKLGIRRE